MTIMISQPGAGTAPEPSISHEPAALLTMVYTLLDDVVASIAIDTAYQARLQTILRAAHATEQTGMPVTLLPLLSCQAAGHDPQQALPVAAAWRAAMIAAKLLDDVEDGDVARLSADRHSPAVVINSATGLLAVANLALARLPAAVCAEIQQEFQQTILRTASGQHADLCQHHLLDLEAYLELLGAKSGACFAFAAGAGVRCGSADRALIDRYAQFGYNIGIMAQVANDLAGFRLHGTRGDLANGQRSLAVRYGLAVASPAERMRLELLLDHVRQDVGAERQARHLLVALGAELYLHSEIARYRQRVQSILAPDESARIRPLRNWLAAWQSSFG